MIAHADSRTQHDRVAWVKWAHAAMANNQKVFWGLQAAAQGTPGGTSTSTGPGSAASASGPPGTSYTATGPGQARMHPSPLAQQTAGRDVPVSPIFELPSRMASHCCFTSAECAQFS